MNFDRNRLTKMFGLLCLFFSFYLLVAFTSYFFTWRADHDKVYDFSWDSFFSSVQVDNWLGRLGAFVADTVIYSGFGVASYGLVYLTFKYGLAMIRKTPIDSMVGVLFRTALVMVIVSIVSSYFLQSFEFPWGGVFGESVSSEIVRFLGDTGTVALMFFAILAALVWYRDIDIGDLTWSGFLGDIRFRLAEIFSGNLQTRPRPRTRGVVKSAAKLSTEEAYPEEVGMPDLFSSPKLEADELDSSSSEVIFDLTKRSALFEEPLAPLRPGDDDMEIVVIAPSVFSPEDAVAYRPPVEIVQEDNPNLSEPYDPLLELSKYEFPHTQLLVEYPNQTLEYDKEEVKANKDLIIQTLLNFKIEIEKIKANIGPTVTLYEIIPARGIRIAKIKNLEDDIALSLSALGIRIIAPIPGKGTIGIEVPNKKRQTVGMREVLSDDRFKRAKMDLPIVLGKTIQNEVFVADLTKMPHLLIAGATGQGKSVGINVILISLLFKKHPSQVKLILIDPKKVELFPYARLENHFLGFLPEQLEPIVTDTTRVVHTLNSLIIEMDTRYNLLKKAEVRNIAEYNDKFVARRLNPNNGHAFLPFIVLIIDEFADLIMTAGKEVEVPLGRLAQLARAVGIHLIIATQRPSVNIITGVIKANFPARIAYKVASRVDSRTILDTGGAEQLTGRGDMLLSVGGDIIRLQSSFVDTPEVERVIDFISNQRGFPEPYFLPEFHPESGDGTGGTSKEFRLADMDDMLEMAARLVVEHQHGSTSLIQRRMKLGYNRAGRIMDQMEALGIVGPAEGSKPREVLYYGINELDVFFQNLKSKR